MISNLIKKILPALFVLSVLNANAQVQFSSGSLRLELDKKGFLTELSNQQSGKNYLYTDTLSALLTVVSNNKKYLPATMAYNSSSKTISLKYQPIDVIVEIKVAPKNT